MLRNTIDISALALAGAQNKEKALVGMVPSLNIVKSIAKFSRHLSGPHSTSPGPAAGNIIQRGARGLDHMSDILPFKGVCPI